MSIWGSKFGYLQNVAYHQPYPLNKIYSDLVLKMFSDNGQIEQENILTMYYILQTYVISKQK